MKIGITGGMGFIGSNFCRYLTTEYPDYEIINIDKMGVGAGPANLKDLEKTEKYTFIKGDIRESSLISKFVKHVDAIVNIAAETHVDRSIANPSEFIHNNTLGTFFLLEAIRKHNKQVRFVQVSTDEVYGDILQGAFTEEHPTKPSNPYSASKAAQDMFIGAYYRTYGLNASITRCTNNFGPYQFPEKFIPKTIIRALKNLQVPIYGTGNNIRDWLFVQDHCKAIDLVLKKGKPGEIYNISSGNELPNIEIAKKILNLLSRREDLITFVEDRPGHDLRYSLDSSKLRSNLGWKPKFTFTKALETTVKWYEDNQKWWKPLANKEVLGLAPWRTSVRK